MARILRSEQAPDGQPLAAAFGMYRFDAGDADYFETDDEALLAEADAHPFFTVERTDESGDAIDAEEAAEAAQAERDRLEAAKLHDATKEPRDPNHLALIAEDPDHEFEVQEVTPPSDNAPAPQTVAHEITEEGGD